MTVKPIIIADIPKVCFVNDKIRISWESVGADNVEIVHNGSISTVQLKGSLVFNAIENESFSFIVSNREWSLESEEYKILVYAEDHFRLPRFIKGKQILDIIDHRDYEINCVYRKKYYTQAFLLVSIPVVLTFFSLLNFIANPLWSKLLVLLFSTIWFFSSYYYVRNVAHRESAIIQNVFFWLLSLLGIVYISSIFRICIIGQIEIEYRLAVWVGTFLLLIYVISAINLRRIGYGKI